MISDRRIHAAVLFISAIIMGIIKCPETHASSTLSLQTLEKVVVALKPDKNPDQMLEEKRNLSAYLSKKLARDVEVLIPLSSAVIIEGFANGTIDIGYLSSTGAVTAIEKNAADVLLANEIEGKPYYLSYWIALKDKPYDSVEDLRGQPIAFSSRTSTSGFIIPTWDLYKKGLIASTEQPEDFFGKGNVYYGVGYVSAADRVLEGQAEAAAVSYYVLDKDKHLSAAKRARLKMVASQGPVPTHVIVIRRSIDANDRSLLKDALLALNGEDPDLRDKVFTTRLIVSDGDKHLKSIREAINFVSSMHY